MLSSSALQFLYDLSQNNNRDWFEKNKKRFEAEVKKPFEQTVGALIERMRAFEPGFAQLQAKDCIFRIHRDTRFSKDKTPYKTNVSAVLASGGRKSMHEPGYYIEISFGACNFGGGAYALEKPELHKVRTAIAQDPEAFRSIVGAQAFADLFGDLQGEKNKVMPPEFKVAAMAEPYLYNKQFYFWKEMPPETALGEGFVELAARYFEAARPVNEFLRIAIGG